MSAPELGHGAERDACPGCGRGGVPLLPGAPCYCEDPDPADSEALSHVRAWVEREVSDWYDPVIDPDLHDALRIVAGLPPVQRDAGSSVTPPGASA